jgi:hypothetical protein
MLVVLTTCWMDIQTCSSGASADLFFQFQLVRPLKLCPRAATHSTVFVRLLDQNDICQLRMVVGTVGEHAAWKALPFATCVLTWPTRHTGENMAYST